LLLLFSFLKGVALHFAAANKQHGAAMPDNQVATFHHLDGDGVPTHNSNCPASWQCTNNIAATDTHNIV